MQSFAFLDIADLLGTFHRQHPDVEIHLRPSVGGSQALVDELRRGSLDIAFASVMEDPAGVSTTELGVEELHLVGMAELLPPRHARVKLSTLAEASFVDFPSGWGVRATVDHAFAAAGVPRRVTIEVADVGTCLQLLRAGMGVALMPPSLLPANDQLQARRLASRLTWRVVMAIPSAQPTRAAARALVELVATGRSHP
jgi:DNA-binding transcriptional LysR family regulator